jgi:hypothetical protein
MSLDFSLMEQGIDGNDVIEVFEINITHNLAPMARELGIYRMLWKPEEYGFTKASQMVVPLANAIMDLATNKEKYSTYNPPNGWGSYEGFLDSLCKILSNVVRYPDSKPSSWI